MIKKNLHYGQEENISLETVGRDKLISLISC